MHEGFFTQSFDPLGPNYVALEPCLGGGSQLPAGEAVPSSVTMAGASPETFEALLGSLGLNKPAAKPAVVGLTETAPDMRYRGLGFCDKGDE